MVDSKWLLRSYMVLLILYTFIAVFYLVFGAPGGTTAEQSARLFGFIQAVFLVPVYFLRLRSKQSKPLYVCGIISSYLLALMHISPAYCWIIYSGAFKSSVGGFGVTGNLMIGALHIVMVIWGLFNATAFGLSKRSK